MIRLLRGQLTPLPRLDERQARLAVLTAGIACLVAIAGCSTLVGSAGASVSDANVSVTDKNGPVMEFNYSVSEYSTVLLEGPDDQIINQKEISPENNHSSIYLGEPRAGEYTLVIQREDETKTTKSVTFDGPDPELTSVKAEWSGNTVESVVVTVENSGDLPLGVTNASYSARGQSVDNVAVNEWVEPDETSTFEVATSFGSSVSIQEPGDVRGSVEVETLNETLTGDFSKSFKGANLTVTNINDVWDGNTLETVEVTVLNDGDLQTRANVTVDGVRNSLGPTWNQSLGAGESRTFELGGLFLNVDTVNTGGRVEFDVLVDSPDGHVTETVTHNIQPADVTLHSMTPVWQNGRLTDVQFSVSNSGDLRTEFTAEIAVNGEEVYDTGYFLEAGASENAELSAGYGNDAFAVVTEGGSYEVTLTMRGDEWNVSKSTTTEFEGPSADILSPDSYFIDNYGENTADLSTLDFTIRNTGDVLLSYDTVEVQIDGVTKTEEPIVTTLTPGESTSINMYPDVTVSEGEHEMTVRVIDGGETVAEFTTTVSAGDGQ